MSYEVGDIVTVRTWDDMAKEYGDDTTPDGRKHIHTPNFIFVESMEPSCGENLRVKSRGGHSVMCYVLEGFEDWIYTDEMLCGLSCDNDDISCAELQSATIGALL